jgi:hypothetical protein
MRLKDFRSTCRVCDRAELPRRGEQRQENPAARENFEPMKKILNAAERMDWMQVVLNGGPPCFYLQEDGRFCGRAHRWLGHCNGVDHEYVSLADLLRSVAGQERSYEELTQFMRCTTCRHGQTFSVSLVHDGKARGHCDQCNAERDWELIQAAREKL